MQGNRGKRPFKQRIEKIKKRSLPGQRVKTGIFVVRHFLLVEGRVCVKTLAYDKSIDMSCFCSLTVSRDGFCFLLPACGLFLYSGDTFGDLSFLFNWVTNDLCSQTVGKSINCITTNWVKRKASFFFRLSLFLLEKTFMSSSFPLFVKIFSSFHSSGKGMEFIWQIVWRR